MKALQDFISGARGEKIRGNQLIGWQNLAFLLLLEAFMAPMAHNIYELQ
jgi:hypothetical protein